MSEIIGALINPFISALFGALIVTVFNYEILDRLKTQREIYIRVVGELLICIDECKRSIVLLDNNIRKYVLNVKDCKVTDKEKVYDNFGKYIFEFYLKSENIFHKLTFYQIILNDFKDVKGYLYNEFKSITKLVDDISNGVPKSDLGANIGYKTELINNYNNLNDKVKTFQEHLQDLSNELQIKYLNGIYEYKIKRRKPAGKEDVVMVAGRK